MIFRKRLSKDARTTLTELQRMERYFSLASILVGKNTALIDHGKQFAKQLESLAQLVSQHKQSLMAAELTRLGIQRAEVNVETGRIKPLPNDTRTESGDNAKAA
jgi:hypothetical protein